MKNSEVKNYVLKLKVSPSASRNAIVGWHAGALKVSVTAAPEGGKANAAVIRLIAGQLQLPRKACRLLRGENQREKWLAIDQSEQEVLRLLQAD